MKKHYILLMVFCLIFQWGIGQKLNRQIILSNISSLELASENDFAVFEDSINSNRSSLIEEDLVVLYQRAIDQSQQIKNDSLFFHFSSLLSYAYLDQTDYEGAIKVGSDITEHAQAVRDTLALLSGLMVLGSSYNLTDSLIHSLEALTKAYEIAKIYGDKKMEAHTTIHLSNCYKAIGREKDAISLLLTTVVDYKGKESEEALNIQIYTYTILSGIELRDTIEDINVIIELEEAINLAENHPNFGQSTPLKSGCSQAYFHLFHYYIRKKSNLEKGEYYFQKLLHAEIALGFQKYIASFLHAVANKDLAAAKKYIKKENETIYGEPYLLTALDYYKQIGNVEQELYYSNLLKDEEIENLKADKVNLTNFTNLQLENLEKAKEVVLLEQQVESQKLQRVYLIAISFLLGGLLLSILYAFLQIRKRNKSLKEQKSIIENQANKLKAVNEQKSIFFANVAHEFQTPLSIINGLAKKARSLNNIEEAKPLLPIIIRNGTQLSEFTNQILDLTKTEEISYPLEKNYFYVDELIKYLINDLQYLADAKNIKIELHNTLDHKIIFSDIHKLKIIVKNLISNAIKFSPLHSTINLKLNLIDKKNITIAISDNGKGIPQEDLTTIFDRFYQSATPRREEGFGIGLAICKEYSNALGGHIEVQSILGKGSQFVLHMPTNVNGQAIDTTAIQKFPIEEPLEENLPLNLNEQNKSILIVEDNIDFCKYLSSILSSSYQLIFFHNGYDALDYLKSNSPDLIITDWMLPEMNGLNFLKTLKSSLEDYKRIPTLMLTARGMITDQLKALREGVDDFLVKNFEEKILIQRIEHLLSQSNNGLSKSMLSNGAETSFSYQIVENISRQDQEWLLEFERMVSQRIQVFELNLDEIALLMNMSVTHLGRKMKSITGITSKKYIQEMRFWEARRMLELGLVDSVKAACYSVGFKDQSHFSKKFKDKFGGYPSVYLKEV